MAIYRCNKCGFIEEVAAESIGTQRACPHCGYVNVTHDTLLFISKVLERYFALLNASRRESAEHKGVAATPAASRIDLRGLDLHNTKLIATDVQHGPIHDWFASRNVTIRPKLGAVDTTGFFDEIAVAIGDDYELHRALIDQIRHAQTRNYTSVNVNLSKRSQKEQQLLTAFCRQLYDYSFVSKYFYQKVEKVVRLNLQASQPIRDFFAGEWLEWFALMKVLGTMQSAGGSSACARSLEVVFANEDVHELDVFGLIGGRTPVCVECKTGEFRPYIDRYDTLRKRLGLSRTQFVICVAGLTDEQATGLSAMYDLTFVNQGTLAVHLSQLSTLT